MHGYHCLLCDDQVRYDNTCTFRSIGDLYQGESFSRFVPYKDMELLLSKGYGNPEDTFLKPRDQKARYARQGSPRTGAVRSPPTLPGRMARQKLSPR